MDVCGLGFWGAEACFSVRCCEVVVLRLEDWAEVVEVSKVGASEGWMEGAPE